MFWMNSKEKAALDSAVRSSGRAATALVVERKRPDDHVFQATETRFGGNPYFENGDSWPKHQLDGRPYDFVCQVNLNDCPHRPDLPFDIFTVFYCWAFEQEVERGDTCIVRTYRNASRAKSLPIARPARRDAGDYKVRACSVRLETFMTYPSSMKGFPEITAAASRFWNPDSAYLAALKRLGFRDRFRSRVGGFPTWVQDDTFDGEDLIFLAQIGYEPGANNCIGDAAPIFIAVSAKEPTRIEVDATQSF